MPDLVSGQRGMMKRSEFLSSLAALLGAGCGAPVVQPAAPPATPAPVPPPPQPVAKPRRYQHWAWLTADIDRSDDEYKRLFDMMRASGVADVMAEAFNGSEAFYASTQLPVRADWLGRVLPLAQAAGVRVHAWLWCLPCNVEAVVQRNPEWYMVNNKGESAAQNPPYVPQYRFLCPTQTPVRELLKQRVQEIVKYPVAGVHLDMLQFPWTILPAGLQTQYGVHQETEESKYDYCYCEVCRSEFRKQTDIDPITYNMPGESEVWRQFRYDRLTNLVNVDLIPAIRAAGKLASASVLPDWESARQDWSKWQLDVAVPLLFHGLYEEDISWIGFQTQESVERVADGVACYSGLLISHLSPPDLTGAVRLVLESGARGVGLFSAQTMSLQHWQAFQRVNDEAETAAETSSPAG